MILLALFGSPALAGPCDAHVQAIAETPRDKLPAHYAALHACDERAAEKHFKAYVRASGDVQTLVDLSLRAIELEQYQPVWDMLEQIADFDARKAVAQRVGGLCQDNVGVIPFLKGGYFAANDRAFSMWTEAFPTCSSQALDTWVEQKVVDPPARTYDDKYNSLLDALVDRRKADALEPLRRAAVAASQRGGPFTSVLEKMYEAVKPAEIGRDLSDDAKEALAEAYVAVGNGGVRPEQAALIADRLYQQGHMERAAGLLKVVYGDRVQPDGRLMYGVASVEHCGGEAVVHLASVYEPSKRWSIQADVEPAARAFKQRLKCSDPAEWQVFVTASPVASEAEVAAHGDEVARRFTDRKLAVRIRAEKSFELP